LLGTVAGVLPDVDGIGGVADLLTEHNQSPLDLYGTFHHVLAHNLGTCILVMIVAVVLAILATAWLIESSRRYETEVRAAVEQALQQVPEPYRTALVLRDLEDMSYEEIAEVLAISLGTVKSRITRGRNALRKKLAGYVREAGMELGLLVPADERQSDASLGSCEGSRGGREVEVTP